MRIDYKDAHGLDRVIKLDGFVDRGAGRRPLALEFYGCAWHGCPECFKDRKRICANGKTAEMNYEGTIEREQVIKRSMDLHAVWECKVHEQLKTDKQMKDFFSNTESYGPIDPRDAYFGGRTGPLRMVCDLEGRLDELAMSYLDIQVSITAR